MDKLVQIFGDVAAVLGLLICLVVGLWRILGHYTFGGYESMTLFTSGISFMLAAVLAKVYRIETR
jgi:hypothetical protein